MVFAFFSNSISHFLFLTQYVPTMPSFLKFPQEVWYFLFTPVSCSRCCSLCLAPTSVFPHLTDFYSSHPSSHDALLHLITEPPHCFKCITSYYVFLSRKRVPWDQGLSFYLRFAFLALWTMPDTWWAAFNKCWMNESANQPHKVLQKQRGKSTWGGGGRAGKLWEER